MPVQDGIEATREIVDDATIGRTRVVMLTTFDLDEYVYAALRAGASGFLLKDTTPEDLVGAIRVIAAGEALLAPTVTRRLIGEFARRREPAPFAAAPEIESLTDREREVLVEIASGRSNSEIADRLHMSLSTAKTHVSHLLAKLGARTARSSSSSRTRPESSYRASDRAHQSSATLRRGLQRYLQALQQPGCLADT